MHTIRLIALDLDGTLLTPDTQIPPPTAAALAAAARAGIRLVLVTGRMYCSTVPYARQLELDQVPLITYNGALVRRFPDGAELVHEPVPGPLAREVAAYAEQQGYYIQAYVDDRLYVPEMTEEARWYASYSGVEAHPVGSPISRWLESPSTKLLIVAPPNRMAAVQADLQARFGDRLEFTPSLQGLLEVMARGVSKGRALAEVAAGLGVTREQVLAMGDGMNDLSMLQWAGHPVAMAHAPAALRAAASYVPSAGAGYGVAEALAHFGLVG